MSNVTDPEGDLPSNTSPSGSPLGASSGASTGASTGASLTPSWLAQLERLPGQHWPQGALYVVATPIGNLADLSLRAGYALQLADVIAAEDTRATRVLLQAWGIQTPMMSLHRHNEGAQLDGVLQRLANGERVALVSDAGSPAISDPGGHTVQAVRQAGYPVVALPGPSAVTTALMSFGTSTDQNPSFHFFGFLPPKSAARQKQLRMYKGYDGTLVWFEAPHRIQAMIGDLLTVFGPSREVSVARELTKRFEQTMTLPLAEFAQWMTSDQFRDQGEFVVLLHPEPKADYDSENDAMATPGLDAWMDALLAVVSTRDAAKIMAQALGQPKDVCYAKLLSRSGR